MAVLGVAERALQLRVHEFGALLARRDVGWELQEREKKTKKGERWRKKGKRGRVREGVGEEMGKSET